MGGRPGNRGRDRRCQSRSRSAASRTKAGRPGCSPGGCGCFPVVPEAALHHQTPCSRPHRALRADGNPARGRHRPAGARQCRRTRSSSSAVIASLVNGHETSGSHLLLKGGTVWLTNVILFGLWFWLFDRGGPVRPGRAQSAAAGLPVPADGEPGARRPGWRPHFVDYMYVSFTNSIAFSPTDSMPLSRWAKLLMLFEASCPRSSSCSSPRAP